MFHVTLGPLGVFDPVTLGLSDQLDPWSNGSLCREGACLRGNSSVQNIHTKKDMRRLQVVGSFANCTLTKDDLARKNKKMTLRPARRPLISGTNVIASWIQPVYRMHSQHMVARSKDTTCTSQTDLTNQLMRWLQVGALSYPPPPTPLSWTICRTQGSAAHRAAPYPLGLCHKDFASPQPSPTVIYYVR